MTARLLAAICALVVAGYGRAVAEVRATDDVGVADVVEVPMHFDGGFIRELLVEQLYTAPEGSATVWADDTRCSFVDLRAPEVTTRGDRLRLVSAGEARAGTRLGGLCLAPFHWSGFLEAFLQPEVADGARAIRFRVLASTLYDAKWRKPLVAGTVWKMVAKRVTPWIETLRIDLDPAVREIEELLPLVLAGRDAESLRTTLDSLRLAAPRVTDTGVDAALAFAVPPARSTPAPEPPLSPDELRETHLEQWDAFLTFVVKQVVDPSVLPELRRSFGDLLIEARYAIVEALAPAGKTETDPVPALFVATWERLVPLLRRRAAGLPAATALQYASFIAAGDALAALQRLGPAVGLDVSADGLRRLARALAPLATEDPLVYGTETDPALRALFDLPPLEVPALPPDLPPGDEDGWLWRWLTPRAANAASVLERWAPPDREGVDAYLEAVRTVLEAAGERTLAAASLPEGRRDLYRHLLLATAWQESCWRQFVRKRGAITYLASPVGAVGLMQVNERVWRGLYDRQALRWSIEYNGRAGAEILLRYLEVHDEDGVVDEAEDIVMRTYAVYNAGPGVLRRGQDRRPRRAVERRVLEKYRALRAGDQVGIARCLVGA